MTLYLKQDGETVTYPYSLRALRADNPNTSIPLRPTEAQLAEFGVSVVTPTEKPAASDPITKNVVEDTPTQIKGVWTQRWAEEDALAVDIATRTAAQTYKTEHASLKADTFVQNFIAMSPAQVRSYVDNNVTDLASAKSLLERLAVMMLLLARREFN